MRSFDRFHWEFWPAWAAYLPLAPYLAWLGLRHRSLTVFTAANPGIPTGGLAGESKSEILTHLRVSGMVADFDLIRAVLPPIERIARAHRFMTEHALSYPVVLKPDVGERGSGVAIIRSDFELEGYLTRAQGDTIVQRYIHGVEFGVFYCRYPDEAAGRITSITSKLFPEVAGDGRSTLQELIASDARAACMMSEYAHSCGRPLSDVIAREERVKLVELGSHCRGAIFLNGAQYRTSTLEFAIDRVAKAHPGFYFGRFDVRAESVEAFEAGRFYVLELNGVAAEATHVYDPSVSMLEAYRVMAEHWKRAFEIGALNRKQGAAPVSLRALWKLWLQNRSDEGKFVPVQNYNARGAQEHDNCEREELAVIVNSR